MQGVIATLACVHVARREQIKEMWRGGEVAAGAGRRN